MHDISGLRELVETIDAYAEFGLELLILRLSVRKTTLSEYELLYSSGAGLDIETLTVEQKLWEEIVWRDLERFVGKLEIVYEVV
jgi:hypothetical protein